MATLEQQDTKVFFQSLDPRTVAGACDLTAWGQAAGAVT